MKTSFFLIFIKDYFIIMKNKNYFKKICKKEKKRQKIPNKFY